MSRAKLSTRPPLNTQQTGPRIPVKSKDNGNLSHEVIKKEGEISALKRQIGAMAEQLAAANETAKQQQQEQMSAAIDELEGRLDTLLGEKYDLEQSQKTGLRWVNVDDIAERPEEGDKIIESDVASLAASIQAIGLIEDLVLDAKLRPISGKCRTAALRRLKNDDSDAYNAMFPRGVPAVVLELDWDKQPDECLSKMVEIQRNRRDLASGSALKTQIMALAEKCLLDTEKYHYDARARGGKPPAGKIGLIQHLQRAFRVSDYLARQCVTELLNPHQIPKKSNKKNYKKWERAIYRVAEEIEQAIPGHQCVSELRAIITKIKRDLDGKNDGK